MAKERSSTAGKRPEKVEVTVTTPILGWEIDEKTGQKEQLKPGDVRSIPYAAAVRLSNAPKPRVLMDPEERAAFEKGLKKSKGGAQ